MSQYIKIICKEIARDIIENNDPLNEGDLNERLYGYLSDTEMKYNNEIKWDIINELFTNYSKYGLKRKIGVNNQYYLVSKGEIG
jgi:hypothetical protein